MPHKWLNYYPQNENWSYRSPKYFLLSLQNLLEKHPELKDKISFELIGNQPKWLAEMLAEYGLSENFVSHGFRTYKEVIEIQLHQKNIFPR